MSFNRSGNWSPPTTVHPSELHAPLPPGYSYESLVPPFTTRTPGELLEKYYSERRSNPDRADPHAILRKQVEVFLNHPGNVGAPIGSQGLVGKWKRPNGLAAEPVPVYGTDLVPDGPRAVEFRDLDQEGPSTGVPMAILHGEEANPSRLAGAEDIVLHELRGWELKFIIAWPGYKPERFTIRTISKNGGLLTRFDLGEQIMVAYASFFRKVEKDKLLPSAVGFYNIALHQGLNRRSDSLGVQFMQLRLVRFRNTVGGNWVAEVEIV